MPTALTPRVRTLVVYDNIRASREEINVYHLRGARGCVVADSFPLRQRLRLYLVLSSPRPGRFPAYVKVIEEQSERMVYYAAVDPPPTFEEGSDFLPQEMTINVRFPRVGRYSVQIQ